MNTQTSHSKGTLYHHTGIGRRGNRSFRSAVTRSWASPVTLAEAEATLSSPGA
ncbi:hypothetical protein [Ostreiculturibacter nitratireducens]|uniref:hypothetical protein n=1 Tax=Ostreiculturibacter nitratireducens TaxID=3075226 RepID=UPI0031B59CE8